MTFLSWPWRTGFGIETFDVVTRREEDLFLEVEV